MRAFVGRQPELAVLRARLAAARGRAVPRSSRSRGRPGSARPRWLEHFLARPRRGDPAPVVLRASGEETETLLAYGVVEQLARSAGPAGAGLAGPGRYRRGSARSMRSPSAPGCWSCSADWSPRRRSSSCRRRALGGSAVAQGAGLRAAPAGRRPGPRPAGRARGATCRSCRRACAGWSAAPAGSVLRLRGLDEQDLRDLAERWASGALPGSAARTTALRHAGKSAARQGGARGVPAPDEWRPGEQPLPSPRSFRRLVERPLRRLCARTPGGSSTPRRCSARTARCRWRRRSAEVDRPLPAVDEAAGRDLLVPSTGQLPWTLAFPHPLVRSAVHDGLGPARRHALHTAAAALVERRGGRPAAPGGRRDRAGRRARRRPGPVRRPGGPAPGLAQRRARTSCRPPGCARTAGRQQRLLLRATVWTAADAATPATADDLRRRDPGLPRRPAARQRARLAGDGRRRAGAGRGAACAALGPVRPGDRSPRWWRRSPCRPAMHRYGRLDAAGTVEWCRRALDRTGPDTATRADGPDLPRSRPRLRGRIAEAFAATAGADGASRRRRLRLAAAPLGPRDAAAGRRTTSTAPGPTSPPSPARARELGILNTAAFAFAYLARAEYLAGDWDDAVLHAERAVAINLESDFGFMQSMVVGIAVLVPAARGDWAVAEAHPRRTGEPASRATTSARCVALAMARARIGEARGDAGGGGRGAGTGAALPVPRRGRRAGLLVLAGPLRRGAGRDRPGGRGRRASRPARGAGRPARTPLGDRPAGPGPRPGRGGRRPARPGGGGVPAGAGRGRGGRACRSSAARIELAAGEFLRRAGQRGGRPSCSGRAHDAFAGLGAAPYAERCAKELAASGLPPPRRAGTATGPR